MRDPDAPARARSVPRSRRVLRRGLVYGASFAARQTRMFEEDLRSSRIVTLQQWRARPTLVKWLDAAASAFGSQL